MRTHDRRSYSNNNDKEKAIATTVFVYISCMLLYNTSWRGFGGRLDRFIQAAEIEFGSAIEVDDRNARVDIRFYADAGGRYCENGGYIDVVWWNG